jgi:hypothetical protein
MIELNWDEFYNVVPEFSGEDMKLGTLTIPLNEIVNFGARVGNIPVYQLAHITNSHNSIFGWLFMPQLAMLIFLCTRKASVLNTYFPLTKMLDKTEQKEFYRLAGDIMRQPNFKVYVFSLTETHSLDVLSENNVWGRGKEDQVGSALLIDSVSPRATHIAFFIACHIAEIFFYQRPILNRLLKTSFEIRIATSQEAFEKDGGVAGGCFNAEKRTIQLVLSRLFEGFKGKTPGVAPFLHEFGHLLDHFDVKQPGLSKSFGTLPGMRERDGALFNPQARKLFLMGKKLEWERYMYLHEHDYQDGDSFPIGHPYVFQNDGEFIAGYLEMFFRNPHYFASQNLDLYDSFRLTFGYDPRKAWAEDFPYYVEQNQTFYREHKPPQPGITI